METIIAILFYLGFLTPGTTYTQEQLNSIQLLHQQQIDAAKSTYMRSTNVSPSGTGIIVINDNDKDN